MAGQGQEGRESRDGGRGRRRLKAATALSYRLGEEAPRVVAAGEGRTALRIVESAQESGIPVVEDEALSALLYGLGPGAFIPENAYRAAAAIFAFLEKAKKEKWI